MILYAADLHFGNAKIIEHDNRPFNSITEMDRTMIKLWNSKATNKDKVYI